MNANNKAYLNRLEEDRQHLLYRLDRLGYVPDKDMREALESIRADLKMRLEEAKKNLGE